MTAAPAQASVDALCANPDFRKAVQRHCMYVDATRLGLLNTRIHPHEPMLTSARRQTADVNWFVSQYFAVAMQQHGAAQQVMRSVFGPAFASRTILDFACGHGRMLRFLALTVPPRLVWGCDIQRDAVDFVTAEFGVHGLYSTANPDEFDAGRKFEFIWVASLFSHLPEDLFHRWLAKLVSLLTSDGVLCFTTHNERDITEGVAMPSSGFYFSTVSENPKLDGSIYGATYVTEAYMRDAVARLGLASCKTLRIPRGVAEQELYVLTSSAEHDLSALSDFRRGARGCLDKIDFPAPGALRLQGWVGSLDDGALGQVEIRIDGEPHHAATGVIRNDVARRFGDDRLASAGFDVHFRVAPASRPLFLEITARTERDEVAMIYAGPVGPAIA